MQSYSPLLDDFKDCITRTFIYSFEDCVHARLLQGLFLNMLREESNGQLRMTKSSKIILEIAFSFGEQGRQVLHAYNSDSFRRGWV